MAAVSWKWSPPLLDLLGQCHFFAGIGGWPYALRLAGWPEDREVWTGSCPCQPLSSAGQRKGHADERHLWPAFYACIAECRPSIVFGEQVASADGREWLAGVRADLEALGYAVGCADLCAAGLGAPHIRQRLFWVADAAHSRHQGRLSGRPNSGREDQHRYIGCDSAPCWAGAVSGLGDAGNAERRTLGIDRQDGCDGQDAGRQEAHDEPGASGEVFWSDAVWLPCLDGKARRIEPGSFPLADGVPARVGRLRAYGNAIVPRVAAEFVRAFMETEHE
jgi:DNA (cytosine-5)-methyltransferase 1